MGGDNGTGGTANGSAAAGGGNSELREFLRSRRARITPEEAGLPPQPGSRRVPGLRREEVAQLAGVSMDYYVRLERGRNLHVSESVLDAVARALRLNETERGHLFTLARPTRTRRRPLPPQRVRPGLYRVLETITETPALVLGQPARRTRSQPDGPRAVHRLRRAAAPRAQHGALRVPRRGRPRDVRRLGPGGPQHGRFPAPVREYGTRTIRSSPS